MTIHTLFLLGIVCWFAHELLKRGLSRGYLAARVLSGLLLYLAVLFLSACVVCLFLLKVDL